MNRPGEFRNSAPIIFYDSSRAVLYAANGELSSSTCGKLVTRTIKNPQHGIRAQMVLKLTKYKWRKLKLTAALTSRSERVSLSCDARIRLQTEIFKLSTVI